MDFHLEINKKYDFSDVDSHWLEGFSSPTLASAKQYVKQRYSGDHSDMVLITYDTNNVPSTYRVGE